jgi:hypothetical protein
MIHTENQSIYLFTLPKRAVGAPLPTRDAPYSPA